MFQAEEMNGYCFGYTITADQFQAVNPILILLFIPFFDYIIYPLLGKPNFYFLYTLFHARKKADN